MDYENKYKEALERAREYWETDNDNTLDIKAKGTMEYLFPELIESEDERIKNEIMALIEWSKSYSASGITGDDAKKMLNWLEKQGEQKSVDKSEPKFKVGDWIVSKTSNLVYRVDSILTPQSKCYYLSHNGGIVLVSFADEQNYRLWTIEDAKDGDILACNEEILLFKSYSVQGRISLYCWYNVQTNNFHSKGVDNASLTTRNKICLATKEQRDLLFQKMKEAGYENWLKSIKERIGRV